MNIRLRRIEVFIAVVERGGFSAAADALNIAQSAVSIAIKELERDLGTQLFSRVRRQVELTETGRLLRDRAAPAMDLLKRAREEIRDVESLATGHIVIGAPAMVTQFSLSPLLPAFMKAYPGVRLRVVQAGAFEIQPKLLSGEIDLGLTVYRREHGAIASELLWTFDNVACVHRKHVVAKAGAISWRDMFSHPLALYPRGYHQRELVEQQAAKLGLPLHIVIESEYPNVLLECVMAGQAMTTAPVPAMAGYRELKALKLPVGVGDKLQVSVAWSSERALSKAALALLAFLKSDRLEKQVVANAARRSRMFPHGQE